MKTLKFEDRFITETGAILPGLEIAYNTYGTLNKSADNVIWICHALTANSDVGAWWPGMVGEGLLFDPDRYFIVCANVLGSCYGTTGPASVNPGTGRPWLRDFPLITVRDLVNVHEILRTHLGIKRIHSIIGASIGGTRLLNTQSCSLSLSGDLFLCIRSKTNTMGLAGSKRIDEACHGS
jgi:homoserine O-acetyltransferase